MVSEFSDIAGALATFHVRVTFNVDGTVTSHFGPFDGLCFPQGLRAHSSGIVCKGSKEELILWSTKEDGSICEIPLNIEGRSLEILDVDLEIGMIVVKEGGYEILQAPQMKVFWVF